MDNHEWNRSHASIPMLFLQLLQLGEIDEGVVVEGVQGIALDVEDAEFGAVLQESGWNLLDAISRQKSIQKHCSA